VQKYKNFWNYFKKLIKEKDVFHHSSAITFNLVICAIPFTLLLISIIGYVLSYDDAFREVVRYGQEIFPSFTYESEDSDAFEGAITIETMLDPLISARQVFGIVGIIVLIFFSLGLFHTIKHVVFEIFSIRDRKPAVWELVHNFFTFGLIGGMMVFFAIGISVFSVVSIKTIALPFTDQVLELSWFYTFMSSVFPLIFTLFIFYILFRYISERRMKRRVAFVGALSFTFLFGLAKALVGWYLNYSFFAYRYYYQGYAVLVVIGFWAFYTALLFVISTIVARSFQDSFVKKSLKENPYTSIS
jgi:YihY family inner membrane protein